MFGFNEGNKSRRRHPALRRASNPVVQQRMRGLHGRALVDRLENRTLLSVSIINGAGSGYAGNSDGSDPPDTCGAAGPSSYIDVTNGQVGIYSPKLTGASVVSQNINTFLFSPTIGNRTPVDAGSQTTADSTVIYDNLMGSGRFIIGDIDIDSKTNVSNFNIAVSTSNNPTTLTTADWKFYTITTTEGAPGSTSWTDYPGNPGFNADAVVITFNMAKGTSLTGNAQIVSINANDLLNGVAAPAIFHNDISGSRSFRPVTMHDAVPGDPMWLIEDAGDGSHINVDRMTNVLSNAASFTNTSLAIPAADNFSGLSISPKNPDGSTISDIDSRILKAGEYNHTIAATQKVQVSGNELDTQWYAINVAGTPAFQLVGGVANVGRVGFGANTSAFDPGIDINPAGEIGLSFNESDTVNGAANSATKGFVSTFVTARQPTDAAGTMQPSVLVPAGTGTGNITDRSGDFSGMNVDPVNGTFWADNELGNNGNGATDIANFTPEAKPAVTAPSDQTAVEGASKSFNLGSFADADGSPWSVKIDWGDGVTTSFSTASAGSLGTLPHTYAEEGSYTPKVTVTDSTNLSGTATFNVTVSDPAVIATPVASVNAVEGQSAVNVAVATFTDPGGAEALANYSAQINWGDGTTTTGAITLSAGTFTVAGTHTYNEESATDHAGSNPYQLTVTISHGSAPNTVALPTATVSDAAITPTGGFTVKAVEGALSTLQTVATFIDTGGAEAVSDYSAKIDWGDGTTPSTGTITLATGTFTVQGTHTYAEESAADHAGSNPYVITVTLDHEATTPVTATSKAVVSDPAVTPTGGFTFNAVEGVPSATQTVATFTDPGGAEPVGDYSALIDWGDGTVPSAGSISLASGTYTVQGSHTYATGLGLPDDFGNTFCGATPPTYHKPISVTISHEAAPSALAVSDALIALAPDSAHLTSDGNLIVVGTTGDDDIQITPVGNSGSVRVSVNQDKLGSFPIAAGDRFIVAALAGNDNIQVAGGVRAPAVLYGGPGDDRIKGGGGPTIEVGCEGNDMLIGGHASDLLIAGTGSDRLIGGAGNDILIAGNVVDSSLNEDTKFSHLVNILNGGIVHAVSGGGQDTLTGSSGDNIYYYHFMGSGPFDTLTGKNGISINI